MHIGIFMAIEAPGHAQGFLLSDNFKHSYVPMTARTANSRAQMSAMIEIRVIRELVNPDPPHGGFCLPAFSDHSQFLAVGLYQFMAIHAGLRWRDIRVRRNFNEVMAITAVKAKIVGMDFMAERNRLDRLITNVGIPWREVIPYYADNSDNNNEKRGGSIKWKPIGPFRKDLRQLISSKYY